MSSKRENALIFSFTFMAFVLGTTEYVIVGLLSEVSESFGITVAKAGALVSGFAIAYAIGTPVVMAAASRFPKRGAILTAIGLVLLFNLFSALSPTYGLLLFTRIITAVVCGFAVSQAISVASDAVSIGKRGGAISSILGGFAIANVLGVPIGTYVGQHFEWPAAFVLTALMALIALFLNYIYIPRQLPKAGKISLKDQVGLLTNGRIILAFLIPVLGIGAVFEIYTYITPLLSDVMHVPQRYISWILLVYGLASIVSNWLGGKAAAGNAVSKMRFVLLAQAIVFALFSLTAPIPVLGLICLVLVAGVSYMLNAAAQLYLIDLANRYFPGAKDLAASLLPSAANIGIAGGAAIGGAAAEQAGLIHLPWIAGVMALTACGIAVISCRLDVRSRSAYTVSQQPSASGAGHSK
ncbi:MFS transporter [Paenibacillus beijingensis]|uniref:Major facilitator superfamily (MFS) profile domain-containing protein n=1 Tax=Paenibacillus beijingensis TaxID=1126833 RepID=A0A0D5NHJ0_9BACL|nr:MFS transporter [Paenibacillus beijingensis]AJY74383.1 hypothetical protein VN24_07085 [Paenibacillus beijingensis]